ncbi:hypothetical protein KW438_11100 [Vibrio fluvialis]|nr:hypothetical protein [Vibrio fluvialis]MBY8103419.1 hypothetical protein [Vibrio fluvialis]
MLNKKITDFENSCAAEFLFSLTFTKLAETFTDHIRNKAKICALYAAFSGNMHQHHRFTAKRAVDIPVLPPTATPDAHLFINSGYTGRTWPNNLLHICLAICPLAATHT